jgi:hypothetical protein
MDKKAFYIVGNDISDGYHTFKELYDYRMIYNALWLNVLVEQGFAEQYKIHKSYRHYDGELCFGGGWFIVAADLPTGTISNHYKNENWDLFKIPAVEKSIIEYDGHTPEDAKNRMLSFLKELKRIKI